jgi:hypothetical protein
MEMQVVDVHMSPLTRNVESLAAEMQQCTAFIVALRMLLRV